MKEIQRKCAEFLLEDSDVLIGYIFGSLATGKSGPLSDVDIAVLLKPEFPAENYLDKRIFLHNRLSILLKTNKVDVVVLNEAPPLLAYHVVKDGLVLFVRNESAKICHETRVILDYLDTIPLRRVQTDYLFKRIKDDRFAC